MHGSGETKASGSRRVATYTPHFPNTHDDEAGKQNIKALLGYVYTPIPKTTFLGFPQPPPATPPAKMFGKIALEEAWAIRENFKDYDVATLVPKGIIGPDLVANLLDIHGTRLQQMDENGVDMMVLSLSSPGPQGAIEPKEAEDLARLANDRLSVEVSRTPSRFAALASLSMHDPVQAGEELRRCMTELTGFVGAILNDGTFASTPCFLQYRNPLLTHLSSAY
jgi:hypothetical protein